MCVHSHISNQKHCCICHISPTHSLHCLDLLPVENAQEIAAELIATNGRGVLWVLDGWDELNVHEILTPCGAKLKQ